MTELVFEVAPDEDGRYCAECLTAEIFTQSQKSEELRGNVREAVRVYHFDDQIPGRIRLHLVRDEMLAVG